MSKFIGTDSIKSDEGLKNAMKVQYIYPSEDDPDLQKKIYEKREFYYHKIPARGELKTEKDIKEYRDKICSRKFQLQEHQAMLANLINPDTPYKGILLFHGVGTGKCLSGDQLVFLDGTLIPIKDIWEKYASKQRIPDNENGEWSKPKKRIYVNSMIDDKMELTRQTVNRLYRQKINEKINVIKLDNGTTLKITKSHKLYTENGWTNDFSNVKYVLTPKKLTCKEESIGEKLAYLLGWQISEGHERDDQYCVLITNDVIPVLERCKRYIEDIAAEHNIKINNPNILYPKDRSPYLQVYSKEYVQFLEKDGYVWGNLSKDKKFPDKIMKCTLEEKRTFLRAYFDAEAHVDFKNKCIEISSASKMVIQQLITLLKYFEINMTYKLTRKSATNGKKIKRDYWNGYIRSVDLRRFVKKIGFEIDYKKECIEKICKVKTNPNKNPYAVNKIIKDIRTYTKLPIEVFVFKEYIHTDREPNHESLKQIIANLKAIVNGTYELPIRNRKNFVIDKKYLNDKIKILECRINADFEYSRICSISEVQYDGYVYDLEIVKHHNFVVEGAICHNTCAAINIAQRFLSQVQRYNTKIVVLVGGPLLKQQWHSELLKCTGETFLKETDKSVFISEAERQKAEKNAINNALQYYRFMSYRSFYKKVLGEKIVDRQKTTDDKVKVSYRKTKEGEFERDISIDRIDKIDNSLIIVDESHNLTNNAYGEALLKIIRNSHNLKVVLLTATPMKNLADDIIELINFIRPPDAPMNRDKIFNIHKNHLMDFKPGGQEVFKQLSAGYVSYLRGQDPITFARKTVQGTVPPGLLFTKVISCKMLPFQHKTYEIALKEVDDTLDRRSEAVANFAFPGLSTDRKEVEGYYGREGINIIKNQLKTHYETLNRKIASDILKDESVAEEGELMYPSESGKTITGSILKIHNLKYFSIKFYKALKKLNRLIWGKKGPKTAFVYSNLVKVGIEIFTEILLQNGYLEYDENPNNYKLRPETKCYFCGHTYKEHQQKRLKEAAMAARITKNISESSSEYEKKSNGGEPPHHKFHPATFISVTGKSTEEAIDIIPEDKQRTLTNVFSNVENKEGKYIKFVLGSKVMNEGISLRNVSEVHILDVYFNLGKVDQVIGRAIRHCSHYDITTDENPYPEVKIYKYAVTIDKGLSSEEELYKKSEQKYILVKKVERLLKEVAIDCPLNRNGNIFPEELEIYKNCKPPGEKLGKGEVMCPSICDYTKCDFVCDNPKLNSLHWDEKTKLYKKIPKEKLDYSTFTQTLARNEIENVKSRIKDMYRIEYVYTLEDVLNYVRNSYEGEKRELFDDFFVFKALDELIPITENDFNNYRDTIFDKFNRSGYLIYVKKYYIFQPFDQNEDVPMHYRSTYDKPMQHQLSLYNYLKNTIKYQKYKGDKYAKKKTKDILDPKVNIYDFDSTMDYYDAREENEFVGIIDKESSRRKNKGQNELDDVFKIRERRKKILEKKRGTGIPSLTGAVCSTSKSREYLEDIADSVDVRLTGNETRTEICRKIKLRLLFLEKYSLGKNKLTYIMIPANHAKYEFPYNLEDRVLHIKNKIKDKIRFSINIEVIKDKQTVEGIKNMPKFTIKIKGAKKLEDFADFFKSLGFNLEKDTWIRVLN